MAYVKRDGVHIVGSARWPNPDMTERVADDDPDLLAFESRDPDSPWPPFLADIQAWGRDDVDRQAEAARRQWITSGDGQALSYEAKRREAEAWAAAAGPRSPADYPWLRHRAARLNGVLEADATEAQMQAVATEWNTKAAAWRDAGIAIEAVREQAKEDIDVAANADAVQAVLDGVIWPAPA